MSNRLKSLSVAAIVACIAGCAGTGREDAIMQTAPGDPIGSANIGTGSVTVGASIPAEAKAAGMGLAP